MRPRNHRAFKTPPTVAVWKREVREAHERGDSATLMNLAMRRPPGVEDDPDVAAEMRLTRVIEESGGHA